MCQMCSLPFISAVSGTQIVAEKLTKNIMSCTLHVKQPTGDSMSCEITSTFFCYFFALCLGAFFQCVTSFLISYGRFCGWDMIGNIEVTN